MSQGEVLYNWANDGNISAIRKVKDKYDCCGIFEYADKDEYGYTTLMHASNNAHIDVIKILVDMGADMNHESKDGWTALMIASNNGHTLMIHIRPHIYEYLNNISAAPAAY